MSTPNAHRLPAAIEAAAQRIKQTARQAVERSIESLGLAALSATSVAHRSEILAAQFEMDRKSAVFNLAFDEAFDKRLLSDCLPRGGGPERTTNWADLSLMEDHVVEVKVAAERFGLQMAQACEWELRELSGYLVSAMALDRSEPRQNPLRPELVGLALIHATETVTDVEGSRRILTAELARSLASMLGSTYAAIVGDMRAAGIQPAGLTVRMTDSRATGPASVSGVRQDDESQQRDPSASQSGHFADSSRSGAGPSRAGGLTSAPGRPQRHGASSGEHSGSYGGSYGGEHGRDSGSATMLGHVDVGMMSLIRRLAYVDSGQAVATGHEHVAVDGETEEPQLIRGNAVAPNLIRAHREELRAASKGAIDHMVIDVIGSLFDQILSDPTVPPQMARQIARLQLPVLRAALGDPAFFASRRHPVRRFVNRIASVGSALDNFDDVRGQRFLAKVSELVQEVVQGDFDQIETYDSKLAALEAFVAAEAHSETEEQNGAVAVLQAKEDQLRLHSLYAQQLSGALKDLEAPEFLRDFVAQIWSQVLLKSASVAGADSDSSQRLRQTGRDLLMSVQPKASAVQRKAFLAELPKLMQALSEGMALIALDDSARRAFFAQLLPAHAEALKSSGVRTLDFNLMAKRVEGVLQRRLPSKADLSVAPALAPTVQDDKTLVAPFNADEARQVGLVSEASVDWDGQIDIDLSELPEPSNTEVQIQGLPTLSDADEPTRGKSLADHVQIGFAYQMHLQGKWEKVRLTHVSQARTFFVFRHGSQQRQAVSLTARMLTRLCETGRMRAYESAYLIERATARARKQLAELGARTSH